MGVEASSLQFDRRKTNEIGLVQNRRREVLTVLPGDVPTGATRVCGLCPEEGMTTFELQILLLSRKVRMSGKA